MSQKPAAINPAVGSFKKCSHCGLRNLANKSRCARCKQDLSLTLTEAKIQEPLNDCSGEFGQSKVAVILIVSGVLLLVLGLVYMRQRTQATPEPIGEVAVVQPATPDVEKPAKATSQESPQSKEAAAHVLGELRHLQRATESSMTYDEYDEMLTHLKADLNSTLPSYVDHKPSDEVFRREVESMVRDYTAAENWWKTTIRNSSVLSDADRTERLTASWTSAKTHLENAEQALAR